MNLAHARRLKRAGRMMPPGLAALEQRSVKRAKYSYENKPNRFAPAYERLLRANRRAWEFFTAQPPGYRRLAMFRVMSAAKEETRLNRLRALIDSSAQGKRRQ